MREISSSDNKIYKYALKLKKKKYRDEEDAYLIEGPNLIREAVKCGVNLKTIFLSAGYDENEPETGEIIDSMRDSCFVLSEKLFVNLSETYTPQGIIAVCDKSYIFSETELEDMMARPGGNFIVLDRLQDPGNIGTILRTADAAGFDLAIFLKGTADPYQPKVVRSAAGSLFRIPIIFLDGVSELKAFAQKNKKTLVSTAMDAEIDYFDAKLSENVAIVIGNEGNGVAQDIVAASDIKIRIPMAGQTESLNAAVAAGILMYERIRG